MRFAFCLGLLVAACANPSRHVDEQIKPTTIKSSDGRVLCAVHKIPLTTIRGWRSEAIISEHPIDAAAKKDEECNPNRIFSGESRTRSKECPIPAEITFCRWCDEGVGCDF
jgi:hypothetical protein